jgi:hypothetical protein
MKINFPEGIKEIIVAVGDDLRKHKVMGHSGDSDEDALQEVVNRIRDKGIKDPKKTIEVWDWAAKQYFKLLLIDRRRFEFFRDHELCDPQGKGYESAGR